MQWTFENYRLDTKNAALWRDDEQVVLRPKTFDVLRYLVEHAGELVRKETLLESVWENSYVVEGVLTTSMSELRKIFGDTAKNQRFIATVYRRGYRFIAPVTGDDATPAVGSSAAPATAAAAAPSGLIKGSLPRLRGFIGRGQECESLMRRLADDPECRILSLIGPGGIGKTRLAITVARRLSEMQPQAFTDGYYYVPLQSLDRDDDILQAIADTMELRYSGGESLLAQIIDFLDSKPVLLVLDNFEHLLAQQPVLSEMVAAAPGLKILLTSRESLNVEEAWFHPVVGLGYEDSLDADAVLMFAQRAQRNQPEFDLAEKRDKVLRICRLVEGMPLALELAAGWMKMLSLDEIADEIERGIDILADQQGGDSDRHGSIRAVFIETWQRLTEAERTLLKQFSLFQGGASREAIGEVIGAGLPLLGRLVNKALLRTNRKLRYRMHELIRQFAEEELRRDREVEVAARDRHANYYLHKLGEHITRLRSKDQSDACREIQENFDNIRSAWRWAVERGEIDWLHPAVRSLSLFCDLRGYVLDGLQMFDAARGLIESSEHPQRDRLVEKIKLRSAILTLRLSRYESALVLFREVIATASDDYERALTLRFLGDYHFSHAGHLSAEQARQHLTDCIEICQRIGDSQLQAECLIELTVLYTNLILEIELSQQCAAQAVELARRIGRPDLLCAALDALAWTTNHRGGYQVAENLWREEFDIAEKSGNRAHAAQAINWIGWSAWCVGGERVAEAIDCIKDSLQRYEELGDRSNVAMCNADLATALLEAGELESARDYCRQGLEHATRIGRDDHYVYNLYVLGAVETAAGNFSQAREHLIRARVLAWEQEEQTNKPVVVFYQAQLRFAECFADPENAVPADIEDVYTVAIFLQNYPPTWQAFKDRARLLQQAVEAAFDLKALKILKAMPPEKLKAAALELIPRLLA